MWNRSCLLLVSFLLSGCATSAADRYLSNHPDISTHIKHSMHDNIPCVGMTKEQLQVIGGTPLASIHNPGDANEQTLVYKMIYDDPYIPHTIYVGIKSGKVYRIETEARWMERTRLDEIYDYFRTHPQRSRLKDLVLRGQLEIGMNKAETEWSLGYQRQYSRDIIEQLYHVNKTVTPNGVSEQWVCESLRPQYVYFENDILSSWQDEG